MPGLGDLIADKRKDLREKLDGAIKDAKAKGQDRLGKFSGAYSDGKNQKKKQTRPDPKAKSEKLEDGAHGKAGGTVTAATEPEAGKVPAGKVEPAPRKDGNVLDRLEEWIGKFLGG